MPEPAKNKNILLSSKKNNLYNNCKDCGRQIPQSQKLCVSCKAEKMKEEMRIIEERREHNKLQKDKIIKEKEKEEFRKKRDELIKEDLKKYGIKREDI